MAPGFSRNILPRWGSSLCHSLGYKHSAPLEPKLAAIVAPAMK